MVDEPIVLKRPKRSARSRQQLNLLIFALIMIAGIAAVTYYLLMPDDEVFVLKSYRFAEVTQRSFRQLVTAEGTVVPRITKQLATPATGTVAQLLVKAGQDVCAGDVLCVIDSPSLMSELNQLTKDLQQARIDAKKVDLDSQVKVRELEASLLAAGNDMNEALRMLEVSERLFELGDVSKADLEKYRRSAEEAKREYESLCLTYEATVEKFKFDVELARTKVADLEQRLNETQKDIDALVVKAPFAGRVLEITVSEGDAVQKGASLLTIADLSSSYVSAEIPVNALSLVKVGQPVNISLFGEKLPGTVSCIAPQASLSATSVALEVVFDRMPNTVIPKAACLLEIEVAKKESANSLPRDHYLTSGDSMYIYVLDPESNTARKVPARFGLIDGGYVEIVSGAEKGDLVIVSSYDEFIDKEVVTVSAEGGTRV